MRGYSSVRGKARYFTSERTLERQHLYLDSQRSVMDALCLHSFFSELPCLDSTAFCGTYKICDFKGYSVREMTQSY